MNPELNKTFIKILILSFLLISISTNTQAQNEITEKLTPAEYAEELSTLLPQLIADSSRTYSYFQQYSKLLTSQQDATAFIAFYETFAEIYFQYQNYTRSLELRFMQLRFAKRSKRPVIIAKAYSDLAQCYTQMNAYGNALHYLYKANQIYTAIKDTSEIANTNNAIGIVKQEQGKTTDALENHYLAKSLYIQLTDTFNQGYALSLINIGKIFFELEDYEQANVFFQKALNICHSRYYKTKNSIKPYAYIALTNIRLSEFDLALKFIDSAYQQLSYNPNHLENLFLIHIQGDYNKGIKNYDSSLIFYENAAELAEKYKSHKLYTESLLDIGELYLAKNIFDKAEKYLSLAIIHANKHGILSLERNANKSVAHLFEIQSKTNAALQHYKNFMLLNDSILNYQKKGRLKQLALVEQQRNQIKNIEMANLAAMEKKNFLLHLTVVFIISLLVFTIIVLYGYFLNKRNNHKLTHQHNELTRQKEEIRIQTLQLQNVNNKLHDLASFKHAMYNMIVHDLKNPLNAIIGLSELDPNTENLAYINQAGYEMMNLVLNILDVSKFEEMQIKIRPKHIPMHESVELALKQIQMFVTEKKLNITKEFDPEYQIFADPDLMERIFVNIMSNAVKYTPVGGNISIKHEIAIESKGRFDKISIQDNGIGIPEEKIHLLFRKFEQIEPQKLGAIRSTGLGLVFCKIAIEAHGGKIGVISAEGEGATFWFTLPVK